MNYAKKELRIKYKTLRKTLSEKEIEEKSIAIANQLIGMDIWSNTYFHVFLPIEKHKEVDSQFILHLLAGKDKEVVLSKSDFTTTEMTHFLLTDTTKIKKNQYDIPEPINGIEVPNSKIEVVFVPLLSFDLKGNRIGYGKGFYDKFLSKCTPETLKIGLSFFGAEEEIQDVFETDIRLDFCITPDKIYKF